MIVWGVLGLLHFHLFYTISPLPFIADSSGTETRGCDPLSPMADRRERESAENKARQRELEIASRDIEVLRARLDEAMLQVLP